MKKTIFLSAGLLISYLAVITLLQALIPNGMYLAVALCFATLGVTWGVFTVMEMLYPKPAELTMSEVKTFLKSKTFWLAFMIFISAVVKGVFGFEIGEGQIEEVVNLDWSNITEALFAVFIIAIRKEDKKSPLTAKVNLLKRAA